MIISRVTEPTTEPLTLQEAKDHLRLEHNLDDVYVQALIRAAREYVEKVTWRALMNQTWLATACGFPTRCDFIELPKGNLVSVEAVTYLDGAGVQQTLSPTLYELDQDSVPGRLWLMYGASWPTTLDRWNAVRVRYVAGYGTTTDKVPQPVRQAMLLLVSQMYEHRVPEITGTIVAKVNFAVEALLAMYRLRRF